MGVKKSLYAHLFVGGFTVIRHLPLFNPFIASSFALFSKKVIALYDLLTSFPFRRVVNINALFMISYYFPHVCILCDGCIRLKDKMKNILLVTNELYKNIICNEYILKCT
jgi:hypothetical protein